MSEAKTKQQKYDEILGRMRLMPIADLCAYGDSIGIRIHAAVVNLCTYEILDRKLVDAAYIELQKRLEAQP